ncbi:MAG: hypothetical protein LBI67_11980 [Treponema sp.]|jgi:hypothetical protein|nr:hypothetical protein [Treponema sp.]
MLHGLFSGPTGTWYDARISAVPLYSLYIYLLGITPLSLSFIAPTALPIPQKALFHPAHISLIQSPCAPPLIKGGLFHPAEFCDYAFVNKDAHGLPVNAEISADFGFCRLFPEKKIKIIFRKLLHFFKSCDTSLCRGYFLTGGVMNINDWPTVAAPIVTGLITIIGVLQGNKSRWDRMETKVDNVLLAVDRLVLHDEHLSLEERLEGGESYIKKGGNGPTKIYYEKLAEIYRNRMHDPEFGHDPEERRQPYDRRVEQRRGR